MGRLKGGHNSKKQICSYCGKNEIKARGLCNACYIRWQRYGNCDYRRAKHTNADKIRAMTDEELAKHLYYWDNSPLHASEERWLDWLRQEDTT